MRVTIDGNCCEVIRETGDPVFRNGGWGDGESRLLYHVQQELNRQGFDLIKKRMWRDGHLVDDHQQYLRSRKVKGEVTAIYNGHYAIAGAEVAFNRDGKVTLRVEIL